MGRKPERPPMSEAEKQIAQMKLDGVCLELGNMALPFIGITWTKLEGGGLDVVLSSDAPSMDHDWRILREILRSVDSGVEVDVSAFKSGKPQ